MRYGARMTVRSSPSSKHVPRKERRYHVKMFGLSILKRTISDNKTHYRYGIFHRLAIKIIMTNSRIWREQNRHPSSGLPLKYIVNCLQSSLTKTGVNSVNTTDSKNSFRNLVIQFIMCYPNYHLSPAITPCDCGELSRDCCRKVTTVQSV